MNIDDNIIHLAQRFARGCHPKMNKDELNTCLPYFQLSRTSITPFNYETHNAHIRMPNIMSYLSTNVLPKLQETPKGYYNIEIYDVHSHANNDSSTETDFNNVFCFATRKADPINKHVPLLPDYYFMSNWDNRYNYIFDDFEWSSKQNKIIFVGSSTGNSNPFKNERIRACLWSLENTRRNICHFFIVGFIRMNDRQVFQAIPQLKRCFLQRPVTPKTQMQYKYMLNIDGDTCRWNPDVYFMNTLNLQTSSKDMLWYSPLLKDKEHFVEVSFDEHAPNNILKMYQYYENNPLEGQRIIENANSIRKNLFTKEAGVLYTTTLIDNILMNGAP
jgi:hypothetical protein